MEHFFADASEIAPTLKNNNVYSSICPRGRFETRFTMKYLVGKP
jgi:hypothetical protein